MRTTNIFSNTMTYKGTTGDVSSILNPETGDVYTSNYGDGTWVYFQGTWIDLGSTPTNTIPHHDPALCIHICRYCGTKLHKEIDGYTPHCPNCGALMFEEG